MNLVMTDDGRFVELQGTAEGTPFDANHMADILLLGHKGISELIALQKREFPSW